MCPWISHPLKINLFSLLSPQIQTACRRWTFWSLIASHPLSHRFLIPGCWTQPPAAVASGLLFPSALSAGPVGQLASIQLHFHFLSRFSSFRVYFFSLIGSLQPWKINTIVRMLNWKQKLEEEKEYLKNYHFFFFRCDLNPVKLW